MSEKLSALERSTQRTKDKDVYQKSKIEKTELKKQIWFKRE